MSKLDAFIAYSRFGYGPTMGDISRIEDNPKSWLHNQITAANLNQTPQGFEDLPRREEIIEQARGNRPSREEMRNRNRDNLSEAELRQRQQRRLTNMRQARGLMQKEAAAQLRAAAHSQTPLIERMANFWSNHFTVSVTNNRITGYAGLFQREAIRPHIFGKFEDMLLASTRHGAMLTYLDQAQSIGPNSIAGRNRGVGLNENLAREIMELHTLGVDAGYSQTDVEAFAHVLTGWTIKRGSLDFDFQPRMHEPGPQTIGGRTYNQTGEDQGIAVLKDIANHRATANFIATKLVRHFVADDPPESAITKIAQTFTSTNGNLAAITHALIDLPEVWQTPLPKIKPPFDWLASIVRITGQEAEDQEIFEVLSYLGQPPFTAPSPQGWQDRAENWLAPEALMKRIDLANDVSTRLNANLNPETMLEDILGPVIAPDTEFWIDQAPSTATGMGLILASAEFQRR